MKLPASGDPFDGCVWPMCPNTIRVNDLFCVDHEPKPTKTEYVALRGALWEGNQAAWRKVLARLAERFPQG